VTARTAQEWEKERGLPVHREGNPQRPTVVAYPAELDRWREQARLTGNGSVFPPPAVKKSSRTRLISLLSVLLLVLAVFWATRTDSRLPALCQVDETVLKVFDQRGDLLWAAGIPNLFAQWYKVHPHDPHQIIDLDGDGRPEILFNATFEPSAGRGKLICFDSAGKVRWEYIYGRVKSWGDRTFGDNYRGRLVRVIHSEHGKLVLVVANHESWFPSQVSLLDANTGKQVSEYWHPGWLVSFNIFDLDGDGDPEILLGGTNNPGVGCVGCAVMVALKIPSSPPGEDRDEELDRQFGGDEFRYCAFPSSDVFRTRDGPAFLDHIFQIDADTLSLGISKHVRTGAVRLWYRVDRNFRAIGVTPCDGFQDAHKEFRREGALDHDLTPQELEGLKKTYLYETAPFCHAD
jgi:hypothetical protein